MGKGARYDPGGVAVQCKRCGLERIIPFDQAPFIEWPPHCPHCPASLAAPMLAVRTDPRRRIKEPS